MTARHYTRFIPSEEIGDVTRWQFGSVDGSEVLHAAIAEPDAGPSEVPPAPPGVDEAEHQSLVQQAREEGYARGLAEGQEQAHLQWQQRMDDYVSGQGRETAERLAGLAQAVEASLAGLQQGLAQEVLQLACDIARQVVRQEITGNPRAMLPVVREALDMLVSEGRPATVRLNPADWAALEQPLRGEFGAARIQWLPDATVQPGDCSVESGGAVVDGSLDKRWRRAIAALGLASAWAESGHGD
ncbi:FliH/SctL family protein [Acidovorax sp. SDU_ACID1]|uniref:FliH/SctL family protein n=1 Tax=Acidovorax sp. SDU_ACID1 TaxID=3136632 RepID=UPI0038733E49